MSLGSACYIPYLPPKVERGDGVDVEVVVHESVARVAAEDVQLRAPRQRPVVQDVVGRVVVLRHVVVYVACGEVDQ